MRTALRFRLIVLAAALGLLAIGTSTLREAPVDVLPEFTPTYAEVQTEALGLSATEVENLITVPLEQNLLNGVQGVEVIRSESLPGLSSVVLVFAAGTDVYQARQLVQERLAQAHALPRVSKPPTLLPPLSSSSRVLMIGLSSQQVSPIEKSIIARWTIKPRLMGVPGVANVSIWGLRDEQMQVFVDPEQLRARGVTLEQVVRTAGNAQIVSPLSFLAASTPGAGGFIETPQQRLQVRNVLERLADPRELGKVPVEGTGGRLRLRDVAEQRVGHQPLIGDAVVAGGDGLLLVVEKFPAADPREVTEGVEQALESLRPGLSGMRADTSLFRPAGYIDDALANLTLVLAVGMLLMALALAAALAQWRAAAIALVTVPLSLVAAATVLHAFGETFNAMSLAGLAVALAIIVDDAVLASDALAVRPRTLPVGSAPEGIVLQGSQKRRPASTYGTLIALLAVVPIVVMDGRPGAFFEPVALAYLAAVAAASLVAVTVTPVLALLLLGIGRPRLRISPLVSLLLRPFNRGLSVLTRRPRATVGAAATLGVLTLATLASLDTAAVPDFKDRDVLIQLEAEPGASNPRMTKVATTLSRDLRSLPGVQNAGAHVGRAIGGDQRVDVNSSNVWVNISDGAGHRETLDRIQAVVKRVPGVESEVQTYSASRIRDLGALRSGNHVPAGNDFDVLTGSDEPLLARVYGQDKDELARQAARVRDVMAGIDGVVGARVEQRQEQPNVVIEVDLARAQRFGITPGDVRRAEATLVHGLHVGSVFEEQRVIDVIVQGSPGRRQSVEHIRNLLIDRPGGGHVRMHQVADIRIEPTAVAIRREAVSRYLDVEAGVSGRTPSAAAAELRSRLGRMVFPLEYHAEVSGVEAADEMDTGAIVAGAAVAAIAAFLLFQAAFQSWALALLSFLLLPAALSGGVLVTLLSGRALDAGAVLGLIALLAVAARTSVLSVRRLEEPSGSGNAAARREHVRKAAVERLEPVLATTLALGFALTPVLVLGSRAGLEIVHPMAMVIVGGLLTTTLMTLLFLPALYAHLSPPSLAPIGWERIDAVDRAPARDVEVEVGRAVTRTGNRFPRSGNGAARHDHESTEV